MRQWSVALAACVGLAAGAALAGHVDEIGVPADIAKANRKVEIDMSDLMLFVPSKVEAKKGETIHFVVTNKGKLPHEFVLGSAAELRAHAAMMNDHHAPGATMPGHHAAGTTMPEQHAHEGHEHPPGHYMVEPGRKAEFAWTFANTGVVEFACLIPGHYEGGMHGTIVVKG